MNSPYPLILWLLFMMAGPIGYTFYLGWKEIHVPNTEEIRELLGIRYRDRRARSIKDLVLRGAKPERPD